MDCAGLRLDLLFGVRPLATLPLAESDVFVATRTAFIQSRGHQWATPGNSVYASGIAGGVTGGVVGAANGLLLGTAYGKLMSMSQ